MAHLFLFKKKLIFLLSSMDELIENIDLVIFQKNKQFSLDYLDELGVVVD
jgi:hypothetical protein